MLLALGKVHRKYSLWRTRSTIADLILDLFSPMPSTTLA